MDSNFLTINKQNTRHYEPSIRNAAEQEEDDLEEIDDNLVGQRLRTNQSLQSSVELVVD